MQTSHVHEMNHTQTLILPPATEVLISPCTGRSRTAHTRTTTHTIKYMHFLNLQGHCHCKNITQSCARLCTHYSCNTISVPLSKGGSVTVLTGTLSKVTYAQPKESMFFLLNTHM